MTPASSGARVDSRRVVLVSGASGQQPRHMLGNESSTAFFVASLLFVGVGMGCAMLRPTAANAAAHVPVPVDADCIRVQRHPTHVVAELALGTPARLVETLVRFDVIVPPTAVPLRVFASRASESVALDCPILGNNYCEDVAILDSGDRTTAARRVRVGFEHMLPAQEAAESIDRIAISLGLEAELSLQRGHNYWLTANHLCWNASDGTVDGGVRVQEGDLLANTTTEGAPFTTYEHIANASSLDALGVPRAMQDGKCENQSHAAVALFPGVGASESMYLGISDEHMYDDGHPATLSHRRSVVELGTACASHLAQDDDALLRHFALYLVDCMWRHRCRQQSSIPFRRAAATDMYMQVGTHGTVAVRFQRRRFLELIPGASDPEYAVALASAKLVLMLLAAATLWIRADRVTASAQWLYTHCSMVANPRLKHDTSQWERDDTPLLEDALLGLLCTGSRFGVALWRFAHLSEDGQQRVASTELVAAAMSFAHWLTRWWLYSPNLFRLILMRRNMRSVGPTEHSAQHDIKDHPLTRLGGSSAIIDAAMAVLLLYAQPPMLRSKGTFDETARLLMGTLVVLVAAQRVWFSAACCAVMAESASLGITTADQSTVAAHYVSAMYWCAQSTALAVAVADLVATPLAYGLARTSTTSVEVLSLCAFVTLFGLGLPRLVSTAKKIVHAADDAARARKKSLAL